MSRSRSEPALIVDGYNFLLRLVGRAASQIPGGEMGAERDRLVALLDDWSRLRAREVIVVWDGHGRAPERTRGTTRVVFCENHAEADDWIAAEAARREAHGRPYQVVTRDKGLIARLPPGCSVMATEALEADLEALAGGPIGAPHVAGRDGASEIPASREPVDTSKLPRRHGGEAPPRSTPRPTVPLARPAATATRRSRIDDPHDEIPASRGPVDTSKLPRRRSALTPSAAPPAVERRASPPPGEAPHRTHEPDARERKEAKRARYRRAQERKRRSKR